MVRITLILTMAAVVTLSAKDRRWMTGTILDSTAAEAYLGKVTPLSQGRHYDFQPKEGLQTHGRGWINVPHYGLRETYVIESGGKHHIATRVLHNSDKPSRVAEAKDVKFAVEKSKIFILDDKGRTHEFKRLTEPRP